MKITITLLLLSQLIFAEKISKSTELQTKKMNAHSISLVGKTCAELKEEFNNIKTWSARILKSDNTKSTPNCVCSKNTKNKDTCKMEIDDIAPEIVKIYQDKTPKYNGPNCWNSTLVSTGILPHHRFSSPEEMEFWMNSPLCKEKALTDKLQPGDAIAIRTANGEHHGFIYISDKMSWSKNGYSKRSKYDLQTTENVFSVYGVPEKCQRIAVSDIAPEECKSFANVYQCRSWDDYWNEVKESVAVDEEINTRLDNIDCLTSKYVFGDISPSQEAVSLIEATLDVISFEVIDLKNKISEDTPEAEKIYIERAVHRIMSLKQQYSLTSGYY